MQGKAESALITLMDTVLQRNVMAQSSAVYISPYVVDAKYNDCVNTINSDLYGILARTVMLLLKETTTLVKTLAQAL